MPDIVLFYSWIVIIDILMVYGIYTINHRSYTIEGEYIPYKFLFIVCWALCVTGFGSSDYINYIDSLYMMKKYLYLEHFEEVYNILGYYIGYSNFLFRIILSSIIFIGLYYIIKYYSGNKNLTLSIFCTIFLINCISLLRSGVADVVFFIGVLPFFKHKNVGTFILAILCTTIALFLHKSAFILIFPLVLSLLVTKRMAYKMSVLLFPIAIIVGWVIIKYIFSNYFEDSAYANNSMTDNSRSAIITRFFDYFFWFVIIVLIIFDRFRFLTRYGFQSLINRMTFWFGYISILLMLSPGSHYMYARTINHAFIPILFSLSWMIKAPTHKYVKNIVIVLCIGRFIVYQLSFYLLNTYYKNILSFDKYITW